jgi:hypothetical protein
MSMQARSGFVVVTLVLSAVFAASPAGACSVDDIDDETAYEIADAVFLASVDAIYPARSGSSANPEVVILRVSDVYKGDVDELQGIVTPAESSSCGVDFVPGGVYVVFAGGFSLLDADAGFYEVNLANGTRLLSEGDLALAVPSSLPNAAGPPSIEAINDQLGTTRDSLVPEAVILVGVLVFVLGIASAFSWRDHRRRKATTAGSPR